MSVLSVYALQRLTSAGTTAVPFKLQGRQEILKMQPFQRLIHNGGLSDLPPVSAHSVGSCPFQDEYCTCSQALSQPVEPGIY